MKYNYSEKFVESVANTSLGGNEGWPLTGPEILPYFDLNQAVDIYDMVMDLFDKGYSYKKIGSLFQTPTMMRYELTSSIVVGLKVADKVGFRKISKEDRLKFLEIFFKSLEALVESDPFCLDEKNLVIPKSELNQLMSELFWVNINDENRRLYNHLSVDLFFYAWTLYYNLFASAGFEIHGPYEVVLDGDQYELVVRENFNMIPEGIWDVNPDVNNVKMYLLYKKGTEYKLSYYNQPMTDDHSENLVKVAVVVDGKNIVNPLNIELISKKLDLIATNLAKHINSLPRYEQMMKGAEISFSMLRKLYKEGGKKPDIKAIVESNYAVLGDANLNKGSGEFQERKTKEWMELFDPRTDSLGPIKL
jgi:hypothetical protein